MLIRKWLDPEPVEGNGDGAQTNSLTAGENAGASGALTQDQVNALVGNARTEARKSAINALLKELGFEKPDELKAAVEDARKRREAEMSEVEKAKALIEAAERKAKEHEARLQAVEQERRWERLNNSVQAAASKAGAAYPEDVALWAGAYAKDLLEACIGEDGAVDSKKVDTLIARHKEARPAQYGKAGAPGSPSNQHSSPTDKQRTEQVLGSKPIIRF
jgi:hypothetical protein